MKDNQCEKLRDIGKFLKDYNYITKKHKMYICSGYGCALSVAHDKKIGQIRVRWNYDKEKWEKDSEQC